MGAGGIIIQDGDFASGGTDLFADEGKEILRPFRREIAKQVFFVDGFALQPAPLGENSVD